MWLERPRFEVTQQQTFDEWRGKQAASGARLLSEEAWAIPATAPLLGSQKESQDNLAPILRDWVRLKTHHHLYIEVRERYTNKVIFGPLKIYVHDLAQYMFDTDTVWAFIEQRRAEARRLFNEENATHIKRIEAHCVLGWSAVFDPLLGDVAVSPEGDAEFFIASDELSDAYEEADNFYVAFSVNPFETKTKQQQQQQSKQRETNRNALMSMIAGGQSNNE